MRRYEALPVEQVAQEMCDAKSTAGPVRPIDGDVSASAYDGATQSLRPVNYRLFVVLVIVSVASTVAVVVLHNRQMQRMATMFHERAERARAAGDLDATAENLRRYLDFVSGDRDAKAELAVVLDELADTPGEKLQVFTMMERLLRVDPDRRDVRRRLVNVAMSLGQFDDATLHLQYLLRSTPKDAELRRLLGACFEAEGKYFEAAGAYETAVEQEPRRIELYERLARLFADELEQPEQADRTLNDMVTVNRNVAAAHLARARYKLKRGLLKDALIDAHRAYDLDPADPNVLVAAAGMLVARSGTSAVKSYFDAETIHRQLEAASQDQPGHVDVSRALAQLDLLGGRFDLAEQRLRRALERAPDRIDLLLILTDVLIAQGRREAAQREIDRLRKRKLVPELIAYLEARLNMAAGQWLAAARQLESIRSSALQPLALQRQIESHLGRCYEQLGHDERRLQALQKAVVLDELSTASHVDLAAAFVSVGRLDDAIAQYRLAGDDPAVLLETARLLYYRNLSLPEDKRAWSEVDGLLDKVAAQAASHDELPGVLALRAHVLAAQGQFEQALGLLEQACQHNAGRVELWVAWAELIQWGDRAESAETILDRAHEQLGSSPELFLARARLWVRRGGGEARRALEGMNEERVEYSAAAQLQILRGLAQAFELVEDVDRSEQLWRELAWQTPNDLRVWRKLLERALQSRSDAKARDVVEQMKRIEGNDGGYWRLAEAARHLMLAEQDGGMHLEQARQMLVAADKQLPTSPRVPLGLAELSELNGDEDAAVDHYLEAIDRGENRLEIVERVVRMAYRQGRFRDAHRVTERFGDPVAAVPDGAFSRLVAAVELRAENYDRALELARRAVQSETSDVTDRLWLGHVLWKARRVDEADAEFRAALKQSPARPECWVALVHFLAQTGKTAEAAAAIDQAARRIERQRLSQTLAQCYEAVGKPAEAERYYQASLSADPANVEICRSAAEFYIRTREFDKAEPLLRRLIDREAGAARDITAAKRSLALILLSRDSYPAFREALSLVESNLDINGGTSADLRVKAQLLASRPSRKLRREAVAILETLNVREPLGIVDRRLLTQLYLSLDNWPQARDSLLSLIYGNGESPDLLEFAIRTMLAHEEVKGVAEQWLDALKRLEPNSFRTQELEARRLIADDQLAAGLELLKQASAGQQDAGERRRRTRKTAHLLAELAEARELAGRTLTAEKLAAEAEEHYRRLVDESSESLLDLVRFLGSRWRMPEAFALLEQAWSQQPPEAVAATAVALLRTGKANAQQFRQVRERLAQSLTAKPDSAALWFQSASVAQLEGDYAKAIDGYRKAIANNAGNVAAYNELALLLALREEDRDEALESIDRAIELAGPLAALLDTRGVVHWKLGRLAEAIRDSRDAVAHTPTPTVYFHLAQQYLAQKDVPSAQSAYQRAVAMGLYTEGLHPLERDSFHHMKAQMDRLKFTPPSVDTEFSDTLSPGVN